MGIIGMTVDESGKRLERLPVMGKVAIGEPPSAGKNHPSGLDHFIFQKRDAQSKTGWSLDPDITKKMEAFYGERPTEIEIAFLTDDLDAILNAELAWWGSGGRKCVGRAIEVNPGSGRFEMRAIRRTKAHPEGEAWPGAYVYSTGPKQGQPYEACGSSCPDLIEKRCKHSGDLYFQLYKMPSLGMTWKIHTGGKHSIPNLSSALGQIVTQTGGRLAGIPLRLRVDPQRMTFNEDGDGKSTVKHVLSIVFRAEDLQKLISGAGEYARLFDQSRKALGPARIEIVDDDEPILARSIVPEFYPENAGEVETAATEGGPVRASIPPFAEASPEELAIEARVHELCREMGMNTAGEQMLLGQWAGRLGELVTDLEGRISRGPNLQPVTTGKGGNGKPRENSANAPTAALPAKTLGEGTSLPGRGQTPGFAW